MGVLLISVPTPVDFARNSFGNNPLFLGRSKGH
jgi:hypothetical protein